MLKVGLLGFGFMGLSHYQAYQNLQDIEVVGVFDLEPEKVRNGEISAGNLGEAEPPDLSGVKITDRAEELTGDAGIDIIDICLPTFVHADFAVKALDAGKHVFCEKPMALKPSECDRMLKARDRASRNLMIGHCIRFWPEYVRTREMIQNKEYGEVTSAYFRRLSPTPDWAYENWILDEEKSGGALLDLHVHDIDYILNVFGRVEEVTSFGIQNAADTQSGVDYVVSRYVTESDALITAEGGWHFHAGFPFNMSFHIRCEKASLVFDPAAESTLAIHTEDGKTEYPQCSTATGWDEELKYFAECVAAGTDVDDCPPEESKTAVETALMERTSIMDNRTVKKQ